MQISVSDDLLKTAEALGPVIRDHADEAERQRRPAAAVMKALTDAGLQRLYVPESLGGAEVDPVTYARVAEQIATFDSVAGWALQAGNHIAWWAARLPGEGADEIYRDGPDALIAGAFHPPQKAVEVDGGYRITGRAPLASNIRDADWLFLSGIVMDGDRPRTVGGAPEMLQLILPAREAEVIETWHALGMRGTDSNDVAVDGVFVPQARTFALTPEFEPGPHYRGPLYRLPGMGAIMTIFTPVLLAIARGAIDEFRTLALSKTPMGFNRTLRERPTVQATLAQAEAMWRSARVMFYDTLGEVWQRTRAGEAACLEDKADLMLAGTHAADTVAKITETMHRLAGTSGIYETSRIERHFRDAHTLRHHGLVSPNRFETVGQVYLDVEPEFPFVHV